MILKLKVNTMLKKCQVVMLQSNEKAAISLHSDNTLFLMSKQIIGNYSQHFYIISDDEIKEKDWCHDKTLNIIFQVDEFVDLKYTNKSNLVKKVIATTDSSLKIADFPELKNTAYRNLPQPSQGFIEKYIEEYNKGNQIVDVLVEYEEHGITCNQCYKVNAGISSPDCCGEYYIKEVVKVNPKDNTITIKKVKDSYNREEVINLIEKHSEMIDNTIDYEAHMSACCNVPIPNWDDDKWIEENL